MLGAETDYLGSSCLRIFWFRVKQWISLKSFPLGAAYMRQWIRSAWFTEIMACHLSGAKPLSEPMLGYRELGSWEQNSTNFYSKYKTFHSRKCVWKYRLRNDVKRTFHQLYMNNSITMMTLSNRSIFRVYWLFVRGIHRSPVNSPHKGQWRGTLIFSLIYTWINAWVNNWDAGDLSRHRPHFDVIHGTYLIEVCVVVQSKSLIT